MKFVVTYIPMIQQKKVDFVVLDADIFYCRLNPQTEEDHKDWLELIEQISMNIMQSGRPVLWTMAGNLDKVHQVYCRRFFPDIKVLALTCSEELLRKRMKEGRGITDENWIQGSVEYNEYFRTHDRHGDTVFETFDISGKGVEEVAEYVIEWVKGKC